MTRFASLPSPLALVVPLTLAFALACGGSSTTTPPPPPPAPTAPTTPAPPSGPNTGMPSTPVAPSAPVTPPPAPVAKTFDQSMFVCCDNDRADRLIDKYLTIDARLVAGDADHINGQYTALNGIAKGAIDSGGFSAEESALLKKIADESNADIAKDLAGKRSDFKALSTDVIAFARKHGGSGSNKIAQAHCPMFEGGADWLQKEATVTNPYYGTGASMANCGSFQ